MSVAGVPWTASLSVEVFKENEQRATAFVSVKNASGDVILATSRPGPAGEVKRPALTAARETLSKLIADIDAQLAAPEGVQP